MHFERKSGNFYVLSAVSSLALSRLCGQKTFFSFPPHFSPQPPLFLNSILRVASTKKSFGPSLPLSLRWVTHIPPGPLSTTHLHTVPRGLLLLERAKEREKRREFCGKKGEERTELAGLKMSLSPFPLGERRRERERGLFHSSSFLFSYCDAISCLHFPTKSKKRKIPLNLLYYVPKRLAHVLSLPGQSNFHSVFFCFYFRGLFVGKTKVHCYSLSLSVVAKATLPRSLYIHEVWQWQMAKSSADGWGKSIYNITSFCFLCCHMHIPASLSQLNASKNNFIKDIRWKRQPKLF